MRQTARLIKPALGFLAAALAFLFLFGGIAEAHVSVQPSEAEQGGFTKLTFSVPNELPDANTVGLRVQLPPDHPFAFVSVKPKAGWTFTTTETTLATPIEAEGETITSAVSEITWTGGEIKPGEFDEFEISVGPLPDDADELFFPAIQTYSNGEEVAWIDKPDASGEEPESPAPELTLVAASATGDAHGGGAAVTATTAVSSSEQATATSDDNDDTSKGLAIVAIVVGGLAILLAIVAIATGRKKPTSSA